MAYEGVIANLMVSNVTKTIAFYEQMLGFTRIMSVPEHVPYEWAMLESGGARLMIQSVESLQEEITVFAGKAPGGTFTLYFRVTDILSLYKHLEGKVPFLFPLRETFYGAHEFSIVDLDGYVLVFSQETALPEGSL